VVVLLCGILRGCVLAYAEYRTIIAYRSETRSVFLFSFAKSDKVNLTRGEVAEYKAAAEIYLGLSDNQIAQAVENKELEEVPYHAQEI
jgi:hypothetical protein